MKKLIILMLATIALGQSIQMGNFDIKDTLKIGGLNVMARQDSAINTLCDMLFWGDASFTGDFHIQGKLTVDSLITGKKIGIYAFLNEVDTTTIITSDSLHFLQGSFTNSPSFGFGATVDTLLYTGTDTVYLLIGYDITSSHSMNNSDIKLAIQNDDSTYTNQNMETFAKNAGQFYSFSGHLVLQMHPNHKIKLMLFSNNTGDIIIKKMTAYATRFF